MSDAIVSKSIEITAKADLNSAVDAVNSLNKVLNNLKAALNRIKNLDSSVTTLNNVATALTKLSKAKNVDVSISDRTVEAIKKISDACGSIDNNSLNALRNVATAISKLSKAGNVKVTIDPETIESIKKVSDACESADVDKIKTVANAIGRVSKLEEVDLKISDGTLKGIANIADACKDTNPDAIKSVASALRTLSKLESNSVDISLSQSSLQTLKDIADFGKKLDMETVNKIVALANALKSLSAKKLQAAKDAADSSGEKTFDNQTTDSSGKQASGSSSSSDSGTSWAKEIKSASPLISALKTVINVEIKAIRKEIQITISSLRKVFAIAKKIGSVLVSGFKTAAKFVGKLTTAFAAQFYKPVTNLLSTLKAQFAGLFRVAYYRLFRSMIKAVTQGFSEGIENMYYWASTSDSVLKKSMDSLATSAQYLKNSLAAMVAPLINAIAPVIEQITNQLANLFNMVGKFIAYLTGVSTYTQALRVPTTYADALDDVSDSANNAKKATQWLLGIDELNILPDDTDTGTSSGSSGKTYADYANMFKTAGVDDVPEWLKTIKEMWESGKYAELGTYLADLLNGVVDDWDSYSWGKDIGKKIQNGLTIAVNFLKGAKFKNLGTKVGNAIRGLFETVKAKDIGASVGEIFTGSIEFLEGTLTGAGSWGTWLSDLVNGWFEDVSGQDVGTSVHNIISNILTNMKNFLDGITWEDIKADISGFWDGFNFTDLWEDFKSLLGSAEDAVFALTGTSSWGELAGKIAGWISGALSAVSEYWKTHKSELSSLWEEIKTGIASGLGYTDSNGNGDWDAMFDDLYNKAIDGLSLVFNKISNWLVSSGVGTKIGTALGRLVRSINWKGLVGQIWSAFWSALWNGTDTSTDTGKETYVNKRIAEANGGSLPEGYSYASTQTGTRTVYGETTPSKSIFGNSSGSTSSNPIPVYVSPVKSKSSPTVSEATGASTTQTNPVQVFTTPRLSKTSPTISETIGASTTKTKPITVYTKTETSNSSSTLSELVGTEETKTNPLNANVVLKKGFGYVPLAQFIGTDKTYSVGVTPYLTGSITNALKGQTLTFSVNDSGEVTSSITFKKNGGFVDAGQLFIANESGAEMVGSFDGKTAVANNAQIVEGIQQGVYNAMTRAMSSNGGSNGNVSITLNLDGKTIYDSVVRQNRDAYNRTGSNLLNAF